MNKITRRQEGFSTWEIALAVVVVVIVGLAAWHVHHDKDAQKVSAANSSRQSAAGGSAAGSQAAGTDDQSLQNDLNGINSSSGQATKDLNTASNGLNDSSTFTTLPQ